MTCTIKDVAKEAGVGLGTASRVINHSGNVSKEAKQKVEAAIKKLGYTTNASGLRLRSQKTGVIALLVPIIEHPFFSKFCNYVEKAADEQGYSILLVLSQQRIEKKSQILSQIRRKEVDGAILLTHFNHDETETKGLNIVTIDRHLGKDIPIVTSDNYEATKKGVRYLYDKGCRKIVYLGTKAPVESEVNKRYQGYLDAVKELGLEEQSINEAILHGQENDPIAHFFEKCKDFDGIFASGYSITASLYAALIEKGYKIPNDVQIMSYDGDFTPKEFSPHFTCLDQPIEQLAKKAVEILMDKINGKKIKENITYYNCTIKEGDTTK